jgi:hypothetical protein
VIAIEVAMRPMVGYDHTTIAKWIAHINVEYQIIFDFFQQCIEQNLILNKINMEADGVNDTTTYYAIDLENAKLFQERFEHQLLFFSSEKISLKQFWNKFEFNIDIKLKEIDFDTVLDLLDLVNKNTGEIWNTKFPLIDPYDYEGNLQ